MADFHIGQMTSPLHPQVIAASRRIDTGGLVSSREATMPVVITGLEPEKETLAALLASNIAQRRYLAADDQDVILIIGQAMAARLKVGVAGGVIAPGTPVLVLDDLGTLRRDDRSERARYR